MRPQGGTRWARNWPVFWGEASLQVRVILLNDSVVPVDLAERAQAEVTRLYRLIGVEVVWVAEALPGEGLRTINVDDVGAARGPHVRLPTDKRCGCSSASSRVCAAAISTLALDETRSRELGKVVQRSEPFADAVPTREALGPRVPRVESTT
jgi:hypothetical protein